MVAQESGGKMFDGVDGPLSEHWLAVREFHAYVESRDGLAADFVLAAHVDAAVEFDVVYGETWNLLHVLWFNQLFCDGLQQRLRYAERAVGHRVPEIEILVEVLVGSWRVADDAEA